jgi:hypothetical protein
MVFAEMVLLFKEIKAFDSLTFDIEANRDEFKKMKN